MMPTNSEPPVSAVPDPARRLSLKLIERGFLTLAECDRASKAARERKLDFGEIVVGMGLLTDDQVASVMAEEIGIPYVFPYPASIDRSLLARFPAELLLRHRAVPLAREDGRIMLATSEIPTLSSPRTFEAAGEGPIAFSFTSRRHIERTLRALLPQEPGAAGQGGDLDDPSAVGLLYGHLARAITERADEVRFEPVEGGMVVQYRIGKNLEPRGRHPASMLLSLASRARILIGSSKSARFFDMIGTLILPIGRNEISIDVTISPSRLGECVTLRMGRQAEEAPAGPAPVPAAAAVVRPTIDMASLLLFTKESGGSDLHLSSGATPMVRVHGEMRRLTLPGGSEAPPLAAEEIRTLVFDLLTDAQKSRLEADRELDLSLSIGKETRFRGNVFFQDRGLGAVFRVIPTQIKTCEELGLPPVIKGLAELEKGLILCTGPTGSGKSTTLAALVDHINSTRRGHILTIEDPIEFVHKPKSCMVNQREVGSNTQSFAKALRSALREDPDVILVGEMRDLETISLAITAAETGHLVFGTLHTSSAAKTVDRIINVFPAGEQAQIRSMLADSLQAVIAQILLPKRGGKGRVAAQEVLIASSGVRSLIRDGKTYQIPSAIQTGAKYGMQTLEGALTKLAQNGVIDPSEPERQLAALGLGREDAAGMQGLAGGGTTRILPSSQGIARPLNKSF
jgi:twitching motility protein PilT